MEREYTKLEYRIRQLVGLFIGGWMLPFYALAFLFEFLHLDIVADVFGAMGDWIYEFTDVLKKPEYQKHIKII